MWIVIVNVLILWAIITRCSSNFGHLNPHILPESYFYRNITVMDLESDVPNGTNLLE